MHFGFTTTIDLLSWIVTLALGSKIVATLIVLIVDKEARDRPGWGSILWWVTKIAPVIAMPCLFWIALLEDDGSLMQLFSALALFVIIAVPLAIWKRRKRMTERLANHTNLQDLPVG